MGRHPVSLRAEPGPRPIGSSDFQQLNQIKSGWKDGGRECLPGQNVSIASSPRRWAHDQDPAPRQTPASQQTPGKDSNQSPRSRTLL